MRISKVRIHWSKSDVARVRCQTPGVRYWMKGIGRAVASVALLCFGLIPLSSPYGQETQEQGIQSPEKAHAQQVCPDPPPQTTGSHIFRRLGETFDIPVSIADCQPVALVLHWSNGRNNGSLLNVTFLDNNNQPISTQAVSVFQQGTFEVPFASLDSQPWFATAGVVAVPKTVVIQTLQPFASPAGISYRLTRRPARVRSRSRAELQPSAQPPPQPATQPAAQPATLTAAARLPVLDTQVSMKLRTAEGRLLLQGQGSWASGNGGSVRYKLKEITLPEPREMEIHGRRRMVEFAYRLTMAGGESRGSQPAGTAPVPALSKFGLLWLDDVALPTFSLDSQEISTLIFDRSVLRDGAEISVSNPDGSGMYSLVERFKYQPTVQPGKEAEEGNEVVSIRSAVRVIGATRMPLVQIELRTNRPFPPRESALQLQVGKRFFVNELTGDYTGRTLMLTLTQEMFAELKEGAEIVAFYDKPDRSGFAGRDVWFFGRLDKSRRR